MLNINVSTHAKNSKLAGRINDACACLNLTTAAVISDTLASGCGRQHFSRHWHCKYTTSTATQPRVKKDFRLRQQWRHQFAAILLGECMCEEAEGVRAENQQRASKRRNTSSDCKKKIMLTSDLSSRESVTWCAMEVPASAQVAVSQSVRVSIQGIRHTGARMPAPPAGALTHRFSLLGRLVFNDYECRWRHITSCLVVFADRSCYSCCTRCHGDDGREWWSTFVWQLSRRRAGLLKCVHNADLQHIIIMLSSSSSAYTAASACSDVTDIKLTVDTICGRTAKCMLWLSMHGELVIMAELDESVIA